MIAAADHPFLSFRAFVTRFACPLGEVDASSLAAGLSPEFPAPLSPPDDALRAEIRDLLRHGGFKPTGRSKPASEYLIRAATEGFLAPINAAVDACNVASLHSGFPISVVDLARGEPPFRIALAGADAEYIFNASGQTIDVAGLLCLFDAAGPCANAVKDSQRTKTTPETTATLSVLWGTGAQTGRLDATLSWYQQMLVGMGATVEAA